MKPVKTETSNITFIGEGCQDLPGTRYLCDDGVTPGIETVWELDEKGKAASVGIRKNLFIHHGKNSSTLLPGNRISGEI